MSLCIVLCFIGTPGWDTLALVQARLMPRALNARARVFACMPARACVRRVVVPCLKPPCRAQ